MGQPAPRLRGYRVCRGALLARRAAPAPTDFASMPAWVCYLLLCSKYYIFKLQVCKLLSVS
jgi:hypothetical protein